MLRELFTAFVVCFTLLQAARAQQDFVCANGLERCSWDQWSPWSKCSKSCGVGTRTRSRGICCLASETTDTCLKSCDLQDTSYESEQCEHVCPTGNCTFDNVPDTGLNATDFTLIKDSVDGKIINAPLHITGDYSFCEQSCLNANHNGYNCWTFTFNDKDRCYLYFFNRPLSLIHDDLKGQAIGQSLYLRHCTGAVECRATQADIVFVVDSSGSIGDLNFEKVKVFLQGLVNNLDIDPDLTRVGMLTFNNNVKWQFKLGELDDKLDVLKAIKKTQYVVGGTMTADALEAVRNEGFAFNRTGVPMIAVVITDGLSRFPSLTRVRASILRQMGIQVYSIGVGKNANHEEIFDMASTPEEKYMFEFASFDDLDPANITFDVNYMPCKEKVDVNISATETPTNESTCRDTIDSCKGYGQDVCTDYRPWATAHCSRFCGICKDPNPSEGPCVDELPNCDSFGIYICQDKAYVAWVDKNCRNYCGICNSGVTTTTTTTIMPTTTVKICQDTIDGCDGYINACDDPQYHGYLEARCPATCGFCKSYETVHGNTVNGTKCPDWYLPTECTMMAVDPGCCPLPNCPDGYIVTAERQLS